MKAYFRTYERCKGYMCKDIWHLGLCYCSFEQNSYFHSYWSVPSNLHDRGVFFEPVMDVVKDLDPLG